jgi:NAD(P)-dependent dehydrogenase (short-subunit alcohol dehydrogenase family)
MALDHRLAALIAADKLKDDGIRRRHVFFVALFDVNRIARPRRTEIAQVHFRAVGQNGNAEPALHRLEDRLHGDAAVGDRAAKRMRERESAEGREVFRKVVNISSMAATGGVASHFAYAAAKAGVIGITRTLSKEWGRLKVNVNCVAYGMIETRLNALREPDGPKVTIEGHAIEFGQSRRFRDSTEALIPLGRAGTPEEAADGAYLFCIPESNYISGQVLIVAGGLAI